MTVVSEVQRKGDILSLIESLGCLATGSTISILTRFDAIDLLLRFAIGPRHRPADSIDIVASRHARITLSNAASFLDEAMVSNDNRARIRLHAASLVSVVKKVSGWY
jgi:hypothetical protein